MACELGVLTRQRSDALFTRADAHTRLRRRGYADDPSHVSPAQIWIGLRPLRRPVSLVRVVSVLCRLPVANAFVTGIQSGERALAKVRTLCAGEIGDPHARPGNRNAAKAHVDPETGEVIEENAVRNTNGVPGGSDTADYILARLARDAATDEKAAGWPMDGRQLVRSLKCPTPRDASTGQPRGGTGHS